MDPWEFNFGILAAIQKLKAREITVQEIDCYIGMIPTYRHLKNQESIGKRPEIPDYTDFIHVVFTGAGYDEEIVTVEKLNRFIESAQGKEIHTSFRGYRDSCFLIVDAGEQ